MRASANNRRRWQLASCCLITFVLAGATAQAVEFPGTFPGLNGKIAMSAQYVNTTVPRGIYVVSPDGTGLNRIIHEQQLTTCAGTVYPTIASTAPSWSPDGKTLALVSTCTGSPVPFCKCSYYIFSIYLANADGTNLRSIYTSGDSLSIPTPTWSPDGKRLRFSGQSIRTDGSGLTTESTADDYQSVPSDGAKLDCANGPRISTDGGSSWSSIPKAADGWNTEAGCDASPIWSPDGQTIAYADSNSNLRTTNRDGSKSAVLLEANASDLTINGISWQPNTDPPEITLDSNRWRIGSKGRRTHTATIKSSQYVTGSAKVTIEINPRSGLSRIIKLKQAKLALSSDKTDTLNFEITRKLRKSLLRRLRQRAQLTATVTVTVDLTNAVGKSSSKSVQFKIRR